MFKVFNRGHKIQLNEPELQSASKLSASQYRRQGSLRHSHYFGHSDDYSTLKPSSGVPKLNSHIANSKKYVSCENVRHIGEEYQDVIDEESCDEENGLKEKLVKRYNSLTTLLMKSFRKAKIKKKKEAILNETKLETNYEDSGTLFRPAQVERIERGDKFLSNQGRKDSVRSNFKNVRENSRSTLNRKEINESKYLNDDEIDDEEVKKKEDEEDEEEVNDSTPVFLGVRMISKEFVDLKPATSHFSPVSSIPTRVNNSTTLPRQSTVSKLSDSNESKSNHSTLRKQSPHSTLIKNETKPKMSPLACEKKISKPSLNQTIINAIYDTHLTQSKINRNVDSPKMNFSSHSKPQAPKPPIVPQTPTVQVVAKKNDTEPIQSDTEKKTPSTVIKRSKTFTQQSQDILKDRKKSIVVQQTHETEKQAPQNPPTKETPVEKAEEKIVIQRIELKRPQEESKPSLCYSSDEAVEPDFIRQLNSRLVEKEKEDFINGKMFDLNDVPLNNLSIDKDDPSSTDFKALGDFFAKQDNNFKKKFFDCLMTLLWDTTLPYSEYLLLNKLMTALFGESYHKMDMNYLSQKKNLSVNKLDAEHVLNLIKIYLESSNNNPETKYQTLNRQYPKEDFDVEYSSVSNLINTLKRRQKYDLLADQMENLNSHFDHLIKQEIKPISLEENEFDKLKFLSGFDLSSKKPSEDLIHKPSLIVQVEPSKEEQALLNRYFELDTNPKESGAYSKSQVIDKQDDTLTNGFVRNKLRKTLGNYTATINRRPPPPPLVSSSNLSTNSRTSTKLTETKPVPQIKKEISYETDYTTIKQTAQPIEKPNINSVYKQNPSNVKSSGIIASFQPVSQFIAPASSLNKRTPNSTENNPKTTKTKSSYPNVMTLASNPPKPKMTTYNQQDKEAIQKKLTKIRSVRELFKNDEPTSNNLIYAKPELFKKTEIVSNRDEELIYSQVEKKRSISSNKYLTNPIAETKNLVNKIVSPYSKMPGVLTKAIYTSLGTRKPVGQEQVYLKSKQALPAPVYESKKPIKTIYRPDQVVKTQNLNNLSSLISNKFHKYDSREMKQAYY